METLNVLNGDCAAAAWRECGFPGDVLVWRENYLLGKLPPPDCPLEDFERIRAAELHRFVLGIPEERLLAGQQKMDKRLLCMQGMDSIVLWFDACMFDQTILARVLYLISFFSERPHVSLNCRDVCWDKESLQKYRSSAVALSDADIELGKNAWISFVAGSLTDGDFTRLPFLKEALERFAEESPDASGLGRTQRQLLALVRDGAHTPFSIFKDFDAYEKYPFMGDTMCWKLLDELAERGLIVITDPKGNPFCLSRAVGEELKTAEVTLPK